MATPARPSQPDYEIDFIRLHLSVRWNTVLMPFEQSKFVNLLPNEGYVLEQLFREIPPFGSHREATGAIAWKGETAILTNVDRLALGIEAKDPQTLVAEFNAIEDLLHKRLLFDSPRHALFHELLVQTLVATERDPLAVLRGLAVGKSFVDRFSEKTGIGPATCVGLRLAPLEGEVHSPDWWDFHIEPAFRNPHLFYSVTMVYRTAKREPVIELAQNIRNVLSATIRALEDLHE